MAVTFNSRTMIRIGLGVGVAFILIAVIWAAIYAVTRPTSSDFRTAKSTLVEEVAKTQTKLAPAFDAYQVSFKQAQNETSSIQKATEASVKELKSYQDAESAARQAAMELKSSRVANDSTAGPAVKQYVESSEEYINYFTSLINSYAKFQALFASNEKICIDVLVGDTSGLVDRRDKLETALKDCYPAATRLKESGNVTYSEYATTLENRLKDLQSSSVLVAKGEQDYKQFESEQQALQGKLDALPAGTSSEEYKELQKKVETLTQKIKDSQSAFKSAASKYESIVKELPNLYGDVFTTNVPKRIELLGNLVDVRKKTLIIVLDDKLLE